MNRKERRAAAASARHYRKAGSIDISGGYEAGLEAAGGEQNIVTVEASLGAATVKSAVPIAQLDAALADMDRVAAQMDTRRFDPRQSAMSFVIDAMKKGDHLRQPTGSSVVCTLLRLACTKPDVGGTIKRGLKEGGRSVWWIITEGGPGQGNNWRLVLDGAPDGRAFADCDADACDDDSGHPARGDFPVLRETFDAALWKDDKVIGLAILEPFQCLA